MWGRHAVAQLVEALCYKTECRGVRVPMRWTFFNFHNPSSRTMALGSTQLLTEMSTKYILGVKGWSASRADNLTAIFEPVV
jgi:hypothetical protein